MQQALEEIEQGITETGNGIVCHDRYLEVLPIASYESVASSLQRFILIEDDLPFYTGRLMRELRDRFGQSLEAIALLCELDSTQTVKDRISVDNRVPVENRNFSRRVKYSHYRFVAPLSHEEQRKWLEMADRECIGANTLLAMIKESQGKVTPLHFPESTAKLRHDIDPLPALGSADGGGDYLVERRDEAGSSFGNYANGRDNGETDMSYAIGSHADRLGQESDLQDDIDALNQELISYKEANEELANRLKNAREAMADLQENHRKAVERLEVSNEALQAELEANQDNLYRVLEKNIEAYDPYLLDKLLQASVITQEQYSELIALRQDVSFDDTVEDVVYVNEDY